MDENYPEALSNQTKRDPGAIVTPRSSVSVYAGVLEDEESTRWLLSCYLIAGNFKVVGLTSGLQSIEAVRTGSVDILLVDLGLRGEDGVEVISSIRQFSRIPIVVVSSRNTANEVARALDAGADDYISKPARVDDLIKRVRKALLNATTIKLAAVDGNTAPSAPKFSRRIVGPLGPVEVTPVEAEILRKLMEANGELVSRIVIARECLGSTANSDSRTLDVHISRLRQKMQSVGIPARLGAVRNKGYFFKGAFDLVWRKK
jgi:two-component system, OmpR family, KDP operon response regulator KdpE